MWTRRPRGRGWPVGLFLPQLLIALVLARHGSGFAVGDWRTTGGAVRAIDGLAQGIGIGPVGVVQLALLAAGPVALRLLFGRPAWAAASVAAVDIAYVLAGFPAAALLPSTVVAVIGPIARARREAFWQWQEEERRRRQAERESREAERDRRAEQVRRQAADEQVRMARELHDILAHSLSLINVRASVALEVLDDSPHETRPALLAIKQASRDGLAEVRAVLAGMRPADASVPVPRQPAPSLARLDDLTQQAQAAGLRVAVEHVGARGDLSAAIELAAYRVIQEALTNVMRHSAARSATVTLTYQPDQLEVEITDPGPAQERPDLPEHLPETGSGLVGIRERATALGGTATSGPNPGAGFTVRVRLPRSSLVEFA